MRVTPSERIEAAVRGKGIVAASLARHIGRAGSLLDVGCGDGRTTERLARLVGARALFGVDVQPLCRSDAVTVVPYNGVDLPFPGGAFDAVLLVDVLHHCDEPVRVLSEAVRVARRVVAIKDHVAWTPLSHAVLYVMDLAGNMRNGVPCPGTYFTPAQWLTMADLAGAQLATIEWPLKLGVQPFPELQFTAALVPSGGL